MSVFGGDSWAREAQHRKRRVDDLAIEGLDASSFKKLSNGKFACLVCPNNSVLDSPFMLSMHTKGARHRAAESKRKNRELIRRDEISKRIALSGTVSSTKSGVHVPANVKPLIEQTKKATYDVLNGRASTKTYSSNQCHGRANSAVISFSNAAPLPIKRQSVSFAATDTVEKEKEKEGATVSQHLVVDYRERYERELRFTSSGWKRDGNGRWFKDENVEFDSDEEDPNVCLCVEMWHPKP